MYKAFIKLSLVASTMLFAQKTSPALDIKALPQIIEGINDRYAQKRCGSLGELIEQNRGLDDMAKLVCVNNFFNQIPYQSDIAIWGEKDYWAAPLETIMKGRADCEDYAIAKFYTLVQMGVPQEKLFLTYIKRHGEREPHFILTYYESENAVPLILDNRNIDIVPAMFGDSFEPAYRFNLKDFVAYQEGREHRRVPMDQMKFRKWDELTQRMRSM